MDEQILAKALAEALGPLMFGGRDKKEYLAYAQRATGAPSETAYLYENGGLFGRCDGSSTLVNAMVGPMGVERALTWIGANTEREFIDVLTAIVVSGDNQSTACGNCKTVSVKAASQFYPFGRFCVGTEELQFDRLGLMANSSVPVKTLFGAVTDPAGNTLIPNGSQINDAFMLQTRAAGYGLRREVAEKLWTGDPSNNVGYAYMEPKGFQALVNTGKFDAYTEILSDALDSFILNFGYNNPTSDGTYAITNWFRRMINQLKARAAGANMDWDSADVFIAMRDNAWDCIARVYACAGIDLCVVSGQNRVTASADQARERYEQYLNTMMLPIDGRLYPVVIDNQLPQATGQANGVCSDVYFFVKSINGEEVTYGQYQNFNQTYGSVMQEMRSLFGSDDIAITDNGRYAVVRSNSRGCFDVQLYSKPRIILGAPFLTGRIANVCCNVLGEPFPDVTGSGGVYEPDGGRSITPEPILYD